MRSGLALLFMASTVVLPAASSCAKAVQCQDNSDCDKGYYCSNHSCRVNCSAPRDCLPTEYCDINGECQPGGDGGPLPDGALPDGETPDTSSPDTGTPDTSTTPDSSGPLLRELDPCASTSDCGAGLLCKALYAGGKTRCTPTCSSDSQCFAAGRCLKVGSDTYCVMSDAGKSCSGPGDCNYACLTPGSYCTVSCASGADCPNGYGCMTISSQKVCVKDEVYCGGGTTCSSLKCDTGMVVSSCTSSCSTAADCPQRASVLSPWTCSAGNCKRPGDVWGPLAQGDPAEYACDTGNNPVNLCNDAQHIDFTAFTVPSPPSYSCPVSMSVAGAAGDACVDSCRYQGGCAFGYECTALGNISSSRIGLCLPSLGGTEVGGACTKDGDCAFSYCSASKCSRDCSQDGLCPTGSTCTAVGGSYPNVEGIPFKRCQ